MGNKCLKALCFDCHVIGARQQRLSAVETRCVGRHSTGLLCGCVREGYLCVGNDCAGGIANCAEECARTGGLPVYLGYIEGKQVSEKRDSRQREQTFPLHGYLPQQGWNNTQRCLSRPSPRADPTPSEARFFWEHYLTI